MVAIKCQIKIWLYRKDLDQSFDL